MSDTGTIGERFLDLLCAQAGIICNKSIEDKAGWDFKLDFQATGTPELKNIHKAQPHCQIQVKTTKHKSRTSARVKLSNMLRYATTLEPAFILFVTIDSNQRPVRGHLVHVEKTIIEKTLENVALARHENTGDKLHTRYINIACGKEHLLERLDGQSLRKTLLEYIGDDIHAYMDEKRKLLERIGFTDSPTTINFSIRDQKTLKDLILASLGLKEKVLVQGISSETKRFGGSDESLSFHSESAELSLPNVKPVNSGKLFLKASDYGLSCEFEAHLYRPIVLANPSMALPAFRVDAAPIQLIFDTSFRAAQFTLDFDYQEPRRLAELERYRRLLEILSEPKRPLIFRFEFSGVEAWSTSARLPEELHEKFVGIRQDAEVISKASRIFSYFDVDPSALVSVEDLLLAQPNLATFSALISNKKVRSKVVFDVPEGKEIEYDSAIYISSSAMSIGNLLFGLILSIEGPLEEDSDGSVVMYSENLMIADKLLGFLPDEKFRRALSEKIQDLANSLEEDHNVIIDTPEPWEGDEDICDT